MIAYKTTIRIISTTVFVIRSDISLITKELSLMVIALKQIAQSLAGCKIGRRHVNAADWDRSALPLYAYWPWPRNFRVVVGRCDHGLW
jgi:hypothetical protein